METCMKVLGADFELANSLDTGRRDGNPGEASKRLLDEVPGYPKHHWGGSLIEWGRRFLARNGGSAYIDSDHLEINLPEHTRAADHAAHVHAGLKLAREAQLKASAKMNGGKISVMAAVSDGHQSWGHHLNVCVTRRLFDDMFTRKPHLAGWLATHLATAVVYAGHGQVGPGNDRSNCDYQLSQRADWFEEFVGVQTTHRRPILNMRDESHAGDGFARMHIIYFDNVLSPVANYLKAGATQLVLAMAEAGWADPGLLLDDPLASCQEVSRDLTLKKPLTMARRGLNCSAVELQKAIADLAGEFVQEGLAEGVVPDAADVVRCWRETLDMLARRDLGAAAKRTDWALKYLLLDRQRGRRGLTWQSPEMKVLDLIFSSVDPQEGLFFQMASAGMVEGMPSAETIDRFLNEPPDDTRAYLRAHVLRRFGEHVVSMDWDHVRFRTQTDRWWWSEAVLRMPDPTGFARADCEGLLSRGPTLTELVAATSPEPSHGTNYPLAVSEQREPWGQRWENGSKKTRRSGSYW